MYEKDTLSALDAITEAQRIAFAPMLFQTALCLRNSGVLAWLDKQGKAVPSLEEITEHSTLGSYGVSVLLDMGLSGRIVTQQKDVIIWRKWAIFYCTINDPRKYGFHPGRLLSGLFHLADALQKEKPGISRVWQLANHLSGIIPITCSGERELVRL
jgi:hypothetical protein